MGTQIACEASHYAELVASFISSTLVFYVIQRVLRTQALQYARRYYKLMALYLVLFSFKTFCGMILSCNMEYLVPNLCQILGFMDIAVNIARQICAVYICIETYYIVKGSPGGKFRLLWYIIVCVLIMTVQLSIIAETSGFGKNDKHCSFRTEIGADGKYMEPTVYHVLPYFVPQVSCFVIMSIIQTVVICHLLKRIPSRKSVHGAKRRNIVFKLAIVPAFFIFLQLSQITTRILGENAGNFTIFDDHLRHLTGFLASVFFVALNSNLRREIKVVFPCYCCCCNITGNRDVSHGLSSSSLYTEFEAETEEYSEILLANSEEVPVVRAGQEEASNLEKL